MELFSLRKVLSYPNLAKMACYRNTKHKAFKLFNQFVSNNVWLAHE